MNTSLEPRMSDVVDWLEKLSQPLKLNDLADLPNHIAAYHSKENATQEYVSRALDFLRQPPSQEDTTNWLLALQTNEILALLKSSSFENWVVPSAILLRLGLDRRDPTFVKNVANWLVTIEDVERRRDILRFLDPSSSSYDFDSRLRRIVIVERFREIISTGPLAAITDQSTGLTDPSIAGRTVSAIVNLLSANLAEIQSSSDIASLLSAVSARTYVADKLVRFIRTPSKMAGYFKRLREIAREALLLPLLGETGVDLTGARKLVQLIDDGEALPLPSVTPNGHSLI
jgi:hypothetical protein